MAPVKELLRVNGFRREYQVSVDAEHDDFVAQYLVGKSYESDKWGKGIRYHKNDRDYLQVIDEVGDHLKIMVMRSWPERGIGVRMYTHHEITFGIYAEEYFDTVGQWLRDMEVRK